MLSEAQRRVLERLNAGEKIVPRYSVMFAQGGSKYVRVFSRRPHDAISERTIDALFDKGFLTTGYVLTDKGRAALETDG